jgi:hypothetical protein
MDLHKSFFSILLLFVISIIGTLLLETYLTKGFAIELYIILALLLIGSITLTGISFEKSWGWLTSAILFALLTINAVVVFVTIPQLTTVLIGFAIVLVALSGVVLSIHMLPQDMKITLLDLPHSVVLPKKEAKKKKKK